MSFRPPIWLMLLAVCSHLTAQQGGFLSGTVRDRSRSTVGGAEIRVQNEETAARQKIYCDAVGLYLTSELSPGTYKITVRADGFRTTSRSGINVITGKQVQIDFAIELLPVQQEVTVIASETSEDPMISGVTVSRDAQAASLPQNGHDVHALFELIPGATVTPASLTAGGQFSVGGQRPNSNSFRVDGASGNVGVGVISVPGAFPGGSLPGMTTIGGMQSLASNEETQRVELRSADFAAEFGDRPGAQIDIETRAGTNEFHGSVFGYIRPRFLNSSDWFARGAASDLPKPFLNGWGGSLAGPLWRNHTFFFASVERTDVHDSALQIIAVPSAAARAAAGAPYQALLDAFPQPAGRALTASESVGYSPLEKAAAVSNSSIRLDHAIGEHLHFFARYASVPSSATSIELGTAYSAFQWRSVTAGINIATGRTTQEIRFNYSAASSMAEHSSSDTPALNSLSAALNQAFVHDGQFGVVSLFPGILQVSVGGEGQVVSGQSGHSIQRQLTASYTFGHRTGQHDIRAGGGYTQLSPNSGGFGFFQSSALASPGIESLLAGVPLGLSSSFTSGGQRPTKRWSYFAQDTLHLGNRLDLLLGMRWEMTPSPLSFYGITAATRYSYIGFWTGAGTGLSSDISTNTYSQPPSLPLRYSQLAPRLGLAFHLPWPNLVLRAGAGIFYDTAAGSIVSNENPLSLWQYLPTSSDPSTTGGAPPIGPYSVLSLPRVLEWRTSIEKSFHEQSLFSVSYFGSAGRRLLRNEATIDPQTTVLQTFGFTSHGQSSYQALLAQFRGNLTPDLYFLASYTWSHSIDTGSSDTALELVQPGVSSLLDRGSSSFDIRHLFTLSLGYKLPSLMLTPRLRSYLGGWNISSTLQARTGFPFDVSTVDRSVGLGFDNSSRADLVAGQPLWILDNSAPGGRVLNPAAFKAPASRENGTLGRNVLTGGGLFQIDASLRRQFHLYRATSMELSASAFNLLNHPEFANPVSYLGSALFGQPTSTANLMLGSGSPTTGLTPLFQAGGSRTVELSLRFTF